MIIVAAWIILNTVLHVPPGQIDAPQVVTYLLLVTGFSVILAAFPSAAILYGWYSKNRRAATLLGALLFPAVYVLSVITLSRDNMVFLRVSETVLFLVALSLISMLAGYCAAHHNQRHLAIAIVLAGLWVFTFMSGIN